MDPNQQQFDATQVFGVKKPLSTAEELFHRELERRSLDIIRVKNPDDTDFFVEWDKRYQRVPAHGTADMARFWAIQYCKQKAVDTINKLADKMHAKDIQDRDKSGLPPFESKWHEQQATYSKANYPKTSDKELLAKLYSEYWVGLVYEYGKDQPMQAPDQATTELDMTPVELKIIKELEGRKVDLTEQSPVVEEKPFTGFTPDNKDIETPKEKPAEEVTTSEQPTQTS